jgi:hypothetical protein
MDFPTLLKEVDALSPEQQAVLRQHLLDLEAERWDQALEAAAVAFRGESDDAEMAEIVAAMNMKSVPSEPES